MIYEKEKDFFGKRDIVFERPFLTFFVVFLRGSLELGTENEFLFNFYNPFIKQLHSLVTDDVSLKIMDIFKQEKVNKATGGPSVTATMRSSAELAYQKKVENLLVDENCYKIYIVRF